MFLQRDGKHKEAAEAFGRAAKQSPGDADAVAAQAQALLSGNEVAEAAKVAAVAVAMECALQPSRSPCILRFSQRHSARHTRLLLIFAVTVTSHFFSHAAHPPSRSKSHVRAHTVYCWALQRLGDSKADSACKAVRPASLFIFLAI